MKVKETHYVAASDKLGSKILEVHELEDGTLVTKASFKEYVQMSREDFNRMASIPLGACSYWSPPSTMM